jgi:hypothetical protein
MFKQSRLLALFILPLGLIVMTKSGYAQKKVSLEIGIDISEVKTGSFK